MSPENADRGAHVPPPLSPFTRGTSPSPSASPTTALLHCPPLGRSFSATSTLSDVSSARSSLSRASTGSGPRAAARRGYVRPQAAHFADSARNRDSVMSLGSIAHLQYYFARTGLLDGKGGQLAKEGSKKGTSNVTVSISDASAGEGVGDAAAAQLGGELSHSPIEELPEEEEPAWDDDVMLPPTVSTYSHRTPYVPPPPDTPTLQRELEEALTHVEKALRDARPDGNADADAPDPPADGPGTDRPHSPPRQTDPASPSAAPSSPASGWHTLHGMHLLDVTTLAIKAARDYYTGHEQPQRLAAVRSERRVREDLRDVLAVLQRLAVRSFAGGLRAAEARTVRDWVGSVREILAAERAAAAREARERRAWRWMDDAAWDACSVAREEAFLRTFLDDGETLPTWTPATEATALPTPFLAALASGVLLVQLHNRILRRTRRPFGAIPAWHADTALPYRAAENLRCWRTEAALRWEAALPPVDVLRVACGRADAAEWTRFEDAVRAWCRVVREEVSRDWRAEAAAVASPPPPAGEGA